MLVMKSRHVLFGTGFKLSFKYSSCCRYGINDNTYELKKRLDPAKLNEKISVT